MITRIDEETKQLINSAFDSINDSDKKIEKFYQKVLNFQGKKTYKIAKKIISSVTATDDIIYDPFFGTGSFLIGGSLADRHVIGTELDNYTFNAVRVLLSKCDEEKLDILFSKVNDLAKNNIMSLYETKCCNSTNYISKLHFDPITKEFFNPTPHRDIKDGKNIKLLFKCPICGNRDKKFDFIDQLKIDECNKINTSSFPHHKFIENSRINITSSTGADTYDTNFTNRAKVALIELQKAIDTLEDCIEKEILEYALVFSIALSKIAMYGSGTNNLYHVVEYTAQEMNVWELFCDKINSIKSYKTSLVSVLQNHFNSTDKIEIYNFSFQEYLKSNNKKFKVIYTDPPYTDQVPYLEYQQYYRDWLRCFYDKNKYQLTSTMLEQEIVVSNAPSRKNKDLAHYLNDIDNMFKLFSEHLETNGFVFLTIKLGEKKYFNILTNYIELARKNGLEFVSKYAIENTDPTIRKQAAFLSTLSTQIIICFQKLSKEKEYWYIDDFNVEKYIKEYTFNTLTSDTNHIAQLPLLLNNIKKYLFDNFAYNCSSGDLEKINFIIKSYFIVNSLSIVQLDPNELYIGLEKENNLFVKLYETIPVLIKKLLNQKGCFTIDDLYYEIAVILCEYDPRLFDAFLKNYTYKASINSLINNYCEESNHMFVKRKIQNVRSDGAIDISCLDGYEFEELTKKLLIKEGYKNVVRIGGAGDRGVDLIAQEPNTGMNVIFQCKRWISNVGSDPIQRLHSMMVLDNNRIKKAVCITTSDYTVDGKDIAHKSGVLLINGRQLLEKLEHYFPGKYYHGALDI